MLNVGLTICKRDGVEVIEAQPLTVRVNLLPSPLRFCSATSYKHDSCYAWKNEYKCIACTPTCTNVRAETFAYARYYVSLYVMVLYACWFQPLAPSLTTQESIDIHNQHVEVHTLARLTHSYIYCSIVALQSLHGPALSHYAANVTVTITPWPVFFPVTHSVLLCLFTAGSTVLACSRGDSGADAAKVSDTYSCMRQCDIRLLRNIVFVSAAIL